MDKTLFQQKYPEITPFAQGKGTNFNRFDWAFNAEDTDAVVLEKSKATLENPDATEHEREVANYIVGRNGLKKRLQTQYKIGRIANAVEREDENAELVGWLDLLGLTQPDESAEDSCRIHCGGRSPKETLQYFRDNFKGHIENGDVEAAKFAEMSREEKRNFIKSLHEDELSSWSGSEANLGYSGGDFGFGFKARAIKSTRTMTDDEFDRWSADYLAQTKYAKFWNMLRHSGERKVRLGLALSMTQDENSQKAFIPTLQALPQEDRFEIYEIAHEFKPEINMWYLVRDDFIQSWADIPQAAKNGFEWFMTTPADLKQYVDSQGGLEKIMSDERTKDEFRNKFFVAKNGAFIGVNRFELPFGGGDAALRDYAQRIYEMGKGALELRARCDEIQEATRTKYAPKGYVADHVIQGVSFGIQFGQFALASVVSGGTGSLAGIAAKSAQMGAAANRVANTTKAARLTVRARRLATAAKYADKGAELGQYATKLTIPYFGAMMSVDAQNEAQKAGFTDEEAFVLGAGIGVINSFLERIQFGVRSKNVFLGEKVIRAIENRKDILKTVSMQYCVNGIKNRGRHFGEEYLVENLQNVVQEFGLAIGGSLTDNEYKDAMSIANDLLFQAKDMLIPLFTATNIGAGANFGKAARTFALADTFGKDVVALHKFNADMQTTEALSKLNEADLPALTPRIAQKYFNAATDAERSAVLMRSGMTVGERQKAKKVLGDIEDNLQTRGEELVEAVRESVKSAPDVPLLEDNTPNHAANRAFIADFAKAYGIEEEVVYLDSMRNASKEIVDAARNDLRKKGKSDSDIQELLFGSKGADGFRFDGKIYVVGDKARTPKRTLEILKHETGHRGAEGIRNQTEFKGFLDNLLADSGGEEIVREGMRRAKNGAYDNLDRYSLAEEYMCMLAEKVSGKNELTQEELSSWAKVKNFFVELLSGIPQNEKARDRYIANMIRAIWDREYLADVPDDGEFDFSDEEKTTPEESKPAADETLLKRQTQKAKKALELKLRKRRVFEKKMTDAEREEELEKISILETFDSIPEDDISARLEYVSAVEENMLSDDILEWAANNGAKWAADVLEERIREREKAQIDGQGDSLLDVMASGGYRLPTPKAIITDCKNRNLPLSGTLFGEIRDLYNSLNFYQQQKYFTPNYVDIDDLARILADEHNFPYEGSADFLSDFTQNVWGQKETRFSFADEAPTPEEIREAQRQKDEVKSKWTNPDGTMKKGYHLAPNGKPSKLTEEQWLQVRTPNFKKWFGDWENDPENASKIVDENGEPLVVYHGTDKGGFTEFDTDGEGESKNTGSWFSDNWRIADTYTKNGDRFELLTTFEDLDRKGLIDTRYVIKNANGEIEKDTISRSRESIENDYELLDGDEIVEYYELYDIDGYSIAESANKEEIVKEANSSIKSFIDEDSGTYECFLNIRTPEIYDAEGSNWNEITTGYLVYNDSGDYIEGFATRQDAEDYVKTHADEPLKIEEERQTTNDIVRGARLGQAADGVIIKNVSDEGPYGRGYEDGTNYIVFNPRQIKSSDYNVGTFSENPDIRWSIREDSEIEKIDRQHRELYERYKNGDQAAYEEAAKLVADYAESKGYDVKVYHGTGADGFNVAKADASEAQNGEGAQAHGNGLYLAVMRQTAEGYRDRAPMQERYTIGGKTFEELGLTREKLNHPVIGLVQFLHSRGVEEGKKIINVRIENQTKRLESAETHLQKADDEFVKELSQQTIDNAKKEIASDRKTLNTIDKILSVLEENGLSISDYEYTFNKGKVFDWFTDLKPNEVLDENKPLSEQPEIWKKFKNAWIDMWAYVKRKRIGKRYWEWFNPDKLEKDGYRTAGSVFRKWSEEYGREETTNLLLKNGIRGITYDGNIDGRCYVSFEGGSAVKLQDPFTFDDNGQLIPLSKRFDETNPDMRFSFANNATLNKLRESKPIEIDSKNVPIRIGGSLEMRKKDALNLGKSLRGVYRNKDTRAEIHVVEKSVSELLRHDVDFKKKTGEVNVSFAHLMSVAKIPEIIKSAIYIKTISNEDPKNDGKIDSFDYYLAGLKVDGKDYTVKMVVANATNGEKYYDHALTKIEKGKLIWHSIKSLSRGSNTNNNLPYGVKDKRLADLLQENKSDKIDFSYADNPIHQKKRALAVKLAKDMYGRLGDGFDAGNPDARREVRPTEAERERICMEDLSFLDSDVDDVCNKATAILWKLVSGTPKKTLQSDFDRMAIDAERSFEYSRIVEACVKDAFKDFKKELNLSEKLKAQEQKDVQREFDSVKGFTADELAANGIDLLSAITEYSQAENGDFVSDTDAINAQVDAIIEHCKNWASNEDVSYDLAFAKMRATLTEAFNDLSEKLVYGKHVKSACKAILSIAEAQTEKQLSERAKKIGARFSKFFCETAKEIESAFFEKEEANRAKKRKHEAEEAEKKDKKLHARAVKIFKAFARGQKLPENNRLEIKRELPARVQAYLAQIKKVICLSEDQVKARFEYLSKRKGVLESEGEEPNYKERYEMSALMIFGNIEGHTLPEIMNAYAELKKLIDGAKNEQSEKLEQWEAEIAEKAQPLCAALAQEGNKESAKDGLFYNGAKKNVSMFEHRLRNLFLARKGLSKERRNEIGAWIEEYSQRTARASIFERNMANAEMEWLQNELKRIYGDANKAFERLTKVRKEWSKFASDSGRDMSLGQIMQILCSLEQWQVREAWKRAQLKMQNLESNPAANIDAAFESKYRYWEKLFANQDEMKGLLNAADRELIQSLKIRYGERLETINPVYERLNGLPMISNGANYMPIVRLGEFNIERGNEKKINLFPSYYTPRTISLKPLDEKINILQVFSQRAQTDAHFVNFADLIFETTELLRNGDFANLLRTNLSTSEQQEFADMMCDTLNGKIRRDNTVDGKIASMIANYTAYFGLAFNITSALKQPTSFPAYLLKVPAKDYFGGLKELLTSGELLSSVCEVWNSPFMKDRRNNGEINQILADFARAEKECKGENKIKRFLRRMWVRYAFAPTKYADNFAFVLGGTSVYYHFLKQYREIYSEEEAKRLAMADMMNIGEMTQQSAFIMNMSEGQRQGAGFGRMFSTFRTTNQQYLSFELNAISETMKNPSAANFARLGKILLLNHVILPALFNGAGLLLNLAMGDDWDDDDLDYLMKSTAISCFLDVFTGWWFGAIIKGMAEIAVLGGNKRLTDSMLPASSVARVFESMLAAGMDVYKNGFDADWQKHLDKIGKSVFSPYRIASKIYHNATDDQEGVLW